MEKVTKLNYLQYRNAEAEASALTRYDLSRIYDCHDGQIGENIVNIVILVRKRPTMVNG